PSLLLEGSIGELIPALVTLILGMTAIAAALAGYLLGRARKVERATLIVGGVLMVYPVIWLSAIGLALAALVVLLRVIRGGAGGGATGGAGQRQGTPPTARPLLARRPQPASARPDFWCGPRARACMQRPTEESPLRQDSRRRAPRGWAVPLTGGMAVPLTGGS